MRATALSRIVFSRQRDDWETPADLFAQLDAEFFARAERAGWSHASNEPVLRSA